MFDPRVISQHVAILHRLAAGQSGKLILAVFGEGLAPSVQHFRIGDIVGMTRAALAFDGIAGANVYAPLAVMRADLPEGSKGTEADVIAVLGAVIDGDADKGKAPPYPPTTADYVLETSPGNRQFFMLFDPALAPADAKPMLRALKRMTGADCADDLSHVWRLPGTVNWPSAAKIVRGRSPEPFTVRVARDWNGISRTIVAKLRTVLAPYWEAPRPEPSAAPAAAGEMDAADTAGIVRFLAERDEFVGYTEWLAAGMAIKLALGDAGIDVWRLSHDSTVTAAVEASKWASFKAEPTAGSTTILSLIARARELGWSGSVRKSTAAMFGTVADIAQTAGASLPAGTPGPSNGVSGAMPMLAGQATLTELAGPMLADFVRNTADRGGPRTTDYPTLPAAMTGHGLYEPLRLAIARIIAATENGPKLFKHDKESVIEPLAVLQVVHSETFDAVRRRIASFGCELPDRKIKHAAAALSDRVERKFVSQDDWHYDVRGQIESDNPDNVAVFLGVIGCDIRWNGWRERMEIRGGNDPELTWHDWAYVDDTIVAKLRTRAMRTKTRFRPAKEFLWDVLIAAAHKSPEDPVIDRLNELQATWDKQPRLSTWLSKVCGVAADPYHVAVARNIVGGMVRRARKPGCKHDTLAVLFGPQGTGKSTLAKLLALNAEWFSDSIRLGDASKELVLSLAGKVVVEISEMGMRNSANAADVKAMVSREVDAGRTAYARAVSERPRRNIFIGTTNDAEPLSDPSGNRRFLAVRCERELDLTWLSENVAQIIGEAATLEAAGDDFTIPQEVWAVAAEHAEAARSQSDTEILFSDWFGAKPNAEVAFVTAADVTELCRMAGLRSSNSHRSAIMKALGFRIERPYLNGRQQSVWFRGGEGLPRTIEREATRFIIGTTGSGRVQVGMRLDNGPPLVPAQQPMPMPPLPASSSVSEIKS